MLAGEVELGHPSPESFQQELTSHQCVSFAELLVDCSQLESQLSTSVSTGMNMNKNEIKKEQPLKPSRSQTHPQNLSKHSSFNSPNQIQAQLFSAGPSASHKIAEHGRKMDKVESNLYKLSSSAFSDSCLDVGKDSYVEDSEHGTDEAQLIKAKVTIRKPEGMTKKEMKVTATPSLFFKDGKKRIDYILVYKKSSLQVEKRSTFERNLREEGLMLEREQSITNSDIMFVKIHCPWDTLCKYAERMNIRMPFRKKCYYTDWKNRTLNRLVDEKATGMPANYPQAYKNNKFYSAIEATCKFKEKMMRKIPKWHYIK